MLICPRLEVGRLSRKAQRVIISLLCVSQPGRRAEALNLHLIGPIAGQRLMQCVETGQRVARRSQVAAARRADGAGEVHVRLRVSEFLERNVLRHGERRRLFPLPSLQCVARRNRGYGVGRREVRVVDLLHCCDRVDDLLRVRVTPFLQIGVDEIVDSVQLVE